MAVCEQCGREFPSIEAMAVTLADGMHYVCSDQCAGRISERSLVKLPPLEAVAATSEETVEEKLVREHTRAELAAMAEDAGLRVAPQMNKTTLAELIVSNGLPAVQ